jgi:uncharacterized protein (DUF433 family)
MKSGLPLSFPPHVPIWVDPERMSGAPCFRGTRVPVESLFTNLESGLSLNEYLDCFPEVTREQAATVLEYAHKLALQPAVKSGKALLATEQGKPCVRVLPLENAATHEGAGRHRFKGKAV